MDEGFQGTNITEFPDRLELEDISILNCSNNPILSLSSLPSMPKLKKLLLENTKISSFEKARPQHSLVSVSFIGSPISNNFYLDIMCLVVFGQQLRYVNGSKIMESMIKYAREIKNYVKDYLLDGWIITNNCPLCVSNPKTKKSLSFPQNENSNEDVNYMLSDISPQKDYSHTHSAKSDASLMHTPMKKGVNENNNTPRIKKNNLNDNVSQISYSKKFPLKKIISQKDQTSSAIFPVLDKSIVKSMGNIYEKSTHSCEGYPEFVWNNNMDEMVTLEMLNSHETTQISSPCETVSKEELSTLEFTISEVSPKEIRPIPLKPKHKKPPALSISPPPAITEDGVITSFPEKELSRAELFQLFSKTHRTKISTPDEAERFIQMYYQKRKDRKKLELI